MRAALLDAPEARPRIADVARPVLNNALASVTMRAAALTNLDRMVAEGRHYFSSDAWPHGIGREGVGDHDGRRVFITAAGIPAPLGSFAQYTLAPPDALLPVPPAIDDATAAAIGNAGLAAWLSLSWRARLNPGESVLILGATGASGGVAVTAARRLGAGRIVAAGRNVHRLEELAGSGAHSTVQLGEDLSERLGEASPAGFDVVIDFLNGDPAEQAMHVMRRGGRLVQIGASAGRATRVEAQLARRLSLDVLGFAYYHAPLVAQKEAYLALCDATLAGDITLPFRIMPLDDVDEGWAAHLTGERCVLIP